MPSEKKDIDKWIEGAIIIFFDKYNKDWYSAEFIIQYISIVSHARGLHLLNEDEEWHNMWFVLKLHKVNSILKKLVREKFLIKSYGLSSLAVKDDKEGPKAKIKTTFYHVKNK